MEILEQERTRSRPKGTNRIAKLGELAKTVSQQNMEIIATLYMGMSSTKLEKIKESPHRDSWWITLCILVDYTKKGNTLRVSFKTQSVKVLSC